MASEPARPVSPLVALLTPMNSDCSIDWGAFRAYLDHLTGVGVEAVIACGTTGEFAALTIAERVRVFEFVRGHFRGVVLHHASACGVGDARYLIAATTGSPATGVLLLPPFYHADADAEALLQFFVSVLHDVVCPAYLYRFPRHTQVDFDTRLISRLRDQVPCLRGIKDSSGDWDRVLAMANALPWAEVFVGAADRAQDALQAGLAGSATGRGNPLAGCFVAMREAFAVGDEAAMGAQQRLISAWRRAARETGLAEIPLTKAAMQRAIPGFPTHVRPPFRAVDAPALVLEALASVRGLRGDEA